MQILFTTFDRPDPPVLGNVGHFCVVALNLKLECFQFILCVAQMIQMLKGFFRMAYGIKKVWREANDAKGNKFTPKSIDHYPMHYVRVPKQSTAYVFLT
jgi:hypothetical protein